MNLKSIMPKNKKNATKKRVEAEPTEVVVDLESKIEVEEAHSILI